MTIDLAAIEARKDATTKGPWAWHGWPAGDPLKKTFSQKDSGHKIFTAEMSNADATFVVYARADIPALIAEVKRLEEDQYEDGVAARRENEAIGLQLKRYRELAKVVREIAKHEKWKLIVPGCGDSPIMPVSDSRKGRIVELLKEVEDA